VSNGCFSDGIGHDPDNCEQTVGLCAACLEPQIIHEIGHVVGLFHEQDRNDRDQFVVTHPENMVTDAPDQYVVIGTRGFDYKAFDFHSIMLYPANAFSRDGQPTMTVAPGKVAPPNWGIDTGAAGGSTRELSDEDVAAVKDAYPPTVNPPQNGSR
jgi:astacin